MLMRKRGAPVLVELMKGRPAEPVGAPRPLPPNLALPPTAAASSAGPSLAEALSGGDSSGGQGGMGGLGNGRPWWTQPWYLVAGAISLVLIVWGLAYSLGRTAGERAGEDKLRQVVSADPLAQPPVADPLLQPPTSLPQGQGTQSTPPPADSARPPTGPAPTAPGKGSPASKSQASPPISPPPPIAAPTTSQPRPDTETLPDPTPGVATTLQVGLNYLVVADLGKDDAEAAAAYLRSKGVPTAMVPQRSTQQVVVLRGYPGEVFADRKAERSRIEAVVKRLGRDWKVENRRAPTDFAQVFWAKLRE
jgi:hypothetical protein